MTEEQQARLLERYPLYSADPDCEHELELRWSGYGCTKCPGWHCA